MKATLKNKDVSALSAYEALEARLPLQILEIREFEGRLKKLVYGKATISLKQMQFCFTRDYEDFDDLNNPDSLTYKIFTSPEFKDDESGDSEMRI